MLPQELDALECDQHGIEGTSALLRCQCGMRALSVEGHVEALLRETLHIRAGIRPTMHHKSDIQLTEATTLQHLHLTAERFFCRCTIYDEFKWLITCHVLQCHRCAETSRSLHVMATAMSEISKCIVLAENTELRATLSVLIGRAKRGLESTDTHLYFETVFPKIVGQQTTREYLFSFIFRMIENLICHRAEHIPLCIDRSK